MTARYTSRELVMPDLKTVFEQATRDVQELPERRAMLDTHGVQHIV